MFEQDVDIRKLDKLSIYQLREVGSKVGVRNPTALRCADLKQHIRDVVTGKIKPYHKAKRGRPHKELISADDWENLVGFGNSFEFSTNKDMLSVYTTNSCVYPQDTDTVYSGYVLQMQDEKILSIGNADELIINKYARFGKGLKYASLVQLGDHITATINPVVDGYTAPYLSQILTINGKNVQEIEALMENEKKNSAKAKKDSAGVVRNINESRNLQFRYHQLQFLNDSYPINRGRRALFIGDDKYSGLDFLANSIAKDLSQDYKIVYLSCNKMPESRMAFNNQVDYFFSTFEITPRNIAFNFEVAIERAKNISKTNHTILIVDDLSDVISAYLSVFPKTSETNEERNEDILHQIMSMFACSHNGSSGSLTIFAFASAQRDSQIAEFLKKIDHIINYHFTLDKTAFLNDKEEFLVKTECWASITKRTLAE